MTIPYPAVVSALDKLEKSIAIYLNAYGDFLSKSASLGLDREQEQRLSKVRISMIEVEQVETYVEAFCRDKDPDLKSWKRVRDFLSESDVSSYSETKNSVETYLNPSDVAKVQLWTRVTRFHVDVVNGSESRSTDDNSGSFVSSREIFIVHGHDELTKLQVARFIETELRYKSVILHELPNISRNILSKFLEESRNAIFAIVLMTPDDIGGVAKTELKSRARQNVIFELGVFIGKFGADGVAALIKGDLEKPSDFDGIGYINLDPNEGWKWTLAKEIARASGPTSTKELPRH